MSIITLETESPFSGEKIRLEWHDLMGEPIPELDWRQVHIVANFGGQVLLVYLGKLGLYHLPGGHTEKGEDIETTMRREFAEETGGTITAWEPIGYMQRTNPEGHVHNQLRIYAEVADVKKEVIDVDGHVVHTKLVHLEDMNKVLGWENAIGERILELVGDKFTSNAS